MYQLGHYLLNKTHPNYSHMYLDQPTPAPLGTGAHYGNHDDPNDALDDFQEAHAELLGIPRKPDGTMERKAFTGYGALMSKLATSVH